jgi:hypothetical protein
MGVSMTVNVLGTASTGYLQNLVFHKNALRSPLSRWKGPQARLTSRARATRA